MSAAGGAGASAADQPISDVKGVIRRAAVLRAKAPAYTGIPKPPGSHIVEYGEVRTDISKVPELMTYHDPGMIPNQCVAESINDALQFPIVTPFDTYMIEKPRRTLKAVNDTAAALKLDKGLVVEYLDIPYSPPAREYERMRSIAGGPMALKGLPSGIYRDLPTYAGIRPDWHPMARVHEEFYSRVPDFTGLDLSRKMDVCRALDIYVTGFYDLDAANEEYRAHPDDPWLLSIKWKSTGGYHAIAFRRGYILDAQTRLLVDTLDAGLVMDDALHSAVRTAYKNRAELRAAMHMWPGRRSKLGRADEPIRKKPSTGEEEVLVIDD